MSEHARGTFAVTLTPEESGLPMVGRFALEKTYSGDAVGTGAGVMLSAGDPAAGEAGYVVLEVADLTIGERSGTFAMQQLGYKLLNRVKEDTAPIAKIESEPRFEGRQMVMLLAPRLLPVLPRWP